VKHPERVSHVIVYGIPEPAVCDPSPALTAKWRAHAAMIRQGWGLETPVYRQFFANLFLGPNASPEMLSYFAEMQRASAPADRAVHYFAALGDMDVRAVAPEVRVPTLVVHRRGDLICPFESGRRLAALIPGARFLPLEGENHWLLLEDEGSAAYTEALEGFLARP
jgi:pimeloyl-ACP methyl ester carboxylesterase